VAIDITKGAKCFKKFEIMHIAALSDLDRRIKELKAVVFELSNEVDVLSRPKKKTTRKKSGK
jgi:hypothetical protein